MSRVIQHREHDRRDLAGDGRDVDPHRRRWRWRVRVNANSNAGAAGSAGKSGMAWIASKRMDGVTRNLGWSSLCNWSRLSRIHSRVRDQSTGGFEGLVGPEHSTILLNQRGHKSSQNIIITARVHTASFQVF
ncbi:hypothetical protein CIHG_09694 [Coccidioides immitis H538.4]|uniref:Uncharacterized protein n=1 Tax=Coccidioides immitis H538.4 TaxID=396776 RepID=A0A0J8UVL2_COCIT|nr:hypothetical protein CIHG_09694 [Coccidioides immitis H538.4]